jgi:hypothetical protein
MRFRSRFAHKTIAVALVLFSGCGTTATIRLDTGAVVEGTIVRSNREVIIFDNGVEEDRVPRRTVADIDHPGNVAGTIGLLLSLYGVINIAVGAPKCDEKGAAFCLGVFSPLAAGVILTGYGLSIYSTSVSAAGGGRRGQARSGWVLTPTYAYTREGGGPGLLLLSSF